MIYKFEKLSRKLDELGYPSFEGGATRIMTRDLTKEARADNIDYRDDGVYLTLDGKEYKGFMSLKTYSVSRYNKFPKFHIVRCSTIVEQQGSGKFDYKYTWNNSNIVTIVDSDTGTIHNDLVLELCYNCKKQARVEYDDTEGFFKTLGNIMDDPDLEWEFDIMGYPVRPVDWNAVSKKYRADKNFTCEHPKCGINITEPLDKRFIHVHHKDGIKRNCNVSNLECLCVLCHAHSDDRHLENFQQERLKREVKGFLKKYRDELIRLKNPFVQLY